MQDLDIKKAKKMTETCEVGVNRRTGQVFFSNLAIKYELFELLLVYPVHTINHYKTWENPPWITYLKIHETKMSGKLWRRTTVRAWEFENNECSSREHVFYIKNIHLVTSQAFHSNRQKALGVRKATTPKDLCQYGEENLQWLRLRHNRRL